MSDAIVESQEPPKAIEKDRVRRKLDLSKNSRGIFGQVLGTLSKAKKEDKLRNASEAAQRRQLIEKRLHAKLTKETTSVRRAEQSKKDRIAASRKEEEMAQKENLIRHRHRQLPHIASFLLSTDRIDTEAPDDRSPADILLSLQPPRRALPVHNGEQTVYYLPAKLLPWQEELLTKKATQVKSAVEKEWQEWLDEKRIGLEEVKRLQDSAAELSKEVADEEDLEMAADGVSAEKPTEKDAEMKDEGGQAAEEVVEY